MVNTGVKKIKNKKKKKKGGGGGGEEERKKERKERKDKIGPSSIRRTLELFQRQRWRNFWETGWSPYMGIFERTDTFLN